VVMVVVEVVNDGGCFHHACGGRCYHA